MKIKNGQLVLRIERNGRRRSLRRPKLSAVKDSSELRKKEDLWFCVHSDDDNIEPKHVADLCID